MPSPNYRRLRHRTYQDGCFRGWYYSYLTGPDGRRIRMTFRGTPQAAQTEKLAWEYQILHDRVYSGHAPVSSVQVPQTYRFIEKVHEYLTWGELRGGRQGRPWNRQHATTRQSQLAWWHEQLGCETLADLEQLRGSIDRTLNRLHDGHHAPRTIAGYAESLQAFCAWCIERDYLLTNPTRHLGRLDTTKQSTRRAFTPDEAHAVLAGATEADRLLYLTALCSGLREKELRQLSLFHLDSARGGLRLDAEWTKNRKPGFQPIPLALCQAIEVFARAGTPRQLYERAAGFNKHPIPRHVPEHPLFYVAAKPLRRLRQYLRQAGIPERAHDGYLDFHSWRYTFSNLLDSLGAGAKDTQELMRHASPNLTMSIYVQGKMSRQREVLEALFLTVNGAPRDPTTQQVRQGGSRDEIYQGDTTEESSGSSGISTTDGGTGIPAPRFYLRAVPPPAPDTQRQRSAENGPLPDTQPQQRGAGGDPTVHEILAAWATLPVAIQEQALRRIRGAKREAAC